MCLAVSIVIAERPSGSPVRVGGRGRVWRARVDGSGGDRSGLVGGVDVNEEALDARDDVRRPYGWHGVEGVLAPGDLGVDDGRA